MKRIILLASMAAALLLPGVSKAQSDINDGDFELWTTSTQPKQWTVISGVATRVNGVQYSVKDQAGNTSTVFRPVYDGTYGMQLTSLISGMTASIGIVSNKFALTTRPAFLAFNIGYFPGVQGESPQFALFAYQYNTTTHKRDTVMWTGQFGIQDAQFIAPWATVSVDLATSYKNTNNPDSAILLIGNTGTVNGQTSPNTALIVEKAWLAASKPAGIEMTSTNKVNDNYSFPNPFSNVTNIHYMLKENGQVSIKVYDMAGKLVNTVVNENQVAGGHDVKFDATSLKAGMYFYHVQAGNSMQTGKLILNK